MQTAGLSADGDDPRAPALLTIVATGLTSGLGLETLKQLITRDGAYRVIIGSRNTPSPEQITSSLRCAPLRGRESNT